jgi:hypothetical protein
MDTYPEFSQAEGTTRRMRGGVMIRTATNGDTRARGLASSLRGDPVLVHKALTSTELQELKDFHEAHRGIAFDVDFWPEDITIPCLFMDPPFDAKAYTTGAGLRFTVQVNLVQQT